MDAAAVQSRTPALVFEHVNNTDFKVSDLQPIADFPGNIQSCSDSCSMHNFCAQPLIASCRGGKALNGPLLHSPTVPQKWLMSLFSASGWDMLTLCPGVIIDSLGDALLLLTEGT